MAKISEETDKSSIIGTELRVVFDTYNIGEFGRTEAEMKEMRIAVTDFEELQVKVVERFVEETDIKLESQEFEDIVQLVMYTTYLMMHFTTMYIETGGLSGLTGKSLGDVWNEMPTEDKADVVEMAIVVQDTLAVVHGMYLLLAQLERK